MSGPILTFIVILGIVVAIRGLSAVARRRQFRSRGMDYNGSWIGDIFGQSGGGHHGHHGGGWSGDHTPATMAEVAAVTAEAAAGTAEAAAGTAEAAAATVESRDGADSAGSLEDSAPE